MCKFKRVVVKVGTSSLTHENGKLDLTAIDKIVRQIADLNNIGIHTTLVTSGAVGAGMTRLNLPERPSTLQEKQAVAAVGQGILMHIYEKLFSEYGLNVAQILLTRDDLSIRKRCVNFINTMQKLFDFGVVPIINENDTVATEELKLRFGDNDTLSAMVAGLIEADLLIILSDIDGLYDKDPNLYSDAKLIHMVTDITDDIESMAGGAINNYGTGGMKTKLTAAHIATLSGVGVVIANSREDFALMRIIKGEPIGTHFKPASNNRLKGKSKWIAFGSISNGKIFVDDGAKDAIINYGKSLLPCGIKKIDGEFDIGDTVIVCDEHGHEIAKGIVYYSSDEVKKIMGHVSDQIEDILGFKNYDEVIHRDNLVVIS